MVNRKRERIRKPLAEVNNIFNSNCVMTVSKERLKAIEQQVDKEQRNVKYDIRELTMEYYANKFHKGEMFVPDYQREFVWDEKHESRFIESILLELPVPMIFVAATEDSRWEIVDGSQRVRTIEAFMNDGFELCGLSCMFVLWLYYCG